MRFYLRALSYFKRDVKWVAVLLVLVVAALGLQLLSALPQAIFLDIVFIPEGTKPKDDWLYRIFLLPVPASKLGQVIGVTLVGMFIKVSLDTIGMVRQMINFHIKYRGTALARQDLFEKYEGLSMAFHKDQAQGDAIYRLSQDTGGFYGVLDTFISSGIALVYLIVMTYVMFERNAPLAAFALAITPLMIWTNLHFGRTIKDRAARSKQIDADFMTFTQRSLSAMSLIQMFRRERAEARRFADATARSIRGWWRLNWQEQLYPLTVNLIYALGGAIVFGYGGWLVYRDRYVNPVATPTTVADLAVIMAWLGGIWEPLKTLTGFYANVQTHKAAGERVFKIIDTSTDIVDAPHAISMPPLSRELALRNVEFQYNEDRPVLRGVSATIKPGELVAFVGPSGAGKSTILNLLLRFYDPTRGALTLGGYDLRDIKLVDLRRHLALVPQDMLIIPGTVADNIAYGRTDASFEQIHHAAVLAGAADFINELPDRYYTMLGENGGNLSGGQRQRLAIARALLTDAPILVLDEPTSALDGTQERLIMATLESLRRHRTIVLVTHRLRSVEKCDKIFVLSKGLLAEQGNHQQLISAGGLYASMVRLQAESDEPG